MNFEFNAELWLYPGNGAWVFVTLPLEVAEEIRLLTSSLQRRGFGSIKVTATVNAIPWSTSIFPDSKSKSYLLPIKKDVRKKADASIGDRCDFTIRLEGIY